MLWRFLGRIVVAVAALLVGSCVWASVVCAEPQTYVGQPVIDSSKVPVAGQQFRVRDSYAAERAISGIENPVAMALDSSGTTYVVQEMRTGPRGRLVEDTILRISADGTARTIRSSIRGPVAGVAYYGGYLYIAMAYEPSEVRRVSVRSGAMARVFESLGPPSDQQAPRAFVSIEQRPGSKGLDLRALDSAGAVWHLGYAGGSWMASRTTPKPASPPVKLLSRQGVKVFLGLGVLLVVALGIINWMNRDRV